MKIIDNKKDYYDYLVGSYGEDNLVVYDRRGSGNEVKNWTKELHQHEIAITDQLYLVYTYNGKFYHSPEELKELDKIFPGILNGYNSLRSGYHTKKDKESIEYFTYLYSRMNIPTDINSTKGSPVLIRTTSSLVKRGYIMFYNNNLEEWNVPLLKDYNFNKYISAEDVWMRIYNFLSKLKEVEIKDTRTDKDKIITKGFDIKTSFRK